MSITLSTVPSPNVIPLYLLVNIPSTDQSFCLLFLTHRLLLLLEGIMQQYKLVPLYIEGQPSVGSLSIPSASVLVQTISISTIATCAVSWHFFILFFSGIFLKHKTDHLISWIILQWLLLSSGYSVNSFQISFLTLPTLPLPTSLTF